MVSLKAGQSQYGAAGGLFVSNCNLTNKKPEIILQAVYGTRVKL